MASSYNINLNYIRRHAHGVGVDLYVNLLGNQGPHHDVVPWQREISSQKVPHVDKAKLP